MFGEKLFTGLPYGRGAGGAVWLSPLLAFKSEGRGERGAATLSPLYSPAPAGRGEVGTSLITGNCTFLIKFAPISLPVLLVWLVPLLHVSVAVVVVSPDSGVSVADALPRERRFLFSGSIFDAREGIITLFEHYLNFYHLSLTLSSTTLTDLDPNYRCENTLHRTDSVS